MKKLFLIAAFAVACVVSSYAQDAKAIVDRYMKATNASSMSKDNSSMMMDIEMSMNQGGMSMAINMKSIIKNPGNKMRIEMNMMGQDMLIIANGKQGWMKAQGQVMPLPEDQLKQMTDQGNALGNIMLDENKYDFEYVGEEGNLQIVKLISKDPSAQVQEMNVKFNKATGLLDRMDIAMQGVLDAEMIFEEYKQFGTVKVPSLMKIMMSGETVSTIKVKDLKIDFPTADYMFTEPK